MNISQRQELLNYVQQFEQSDFEAPLAERYKDSGPLEGIVIGDYSLTDILALARRAISQFKKRLEVDDWQILPVVVNYPEWNQGLLTVCLHEMISFMNSADYNSAVPRVKAFVWYQMTCGFWDLSIGEPRSLEEMPCFKMDERIRSISETIDLRQKDSISLLNDLNQRLADLEKLKTDSNAQYDLLFSNRSSSDVILSKLMDLESKAVSTESAIQQIQTRCDTTLNDLKLAQKNIKEQQDSINTQIDTAKTQLENIDDISKNSLTEIQANLETTNNSVDEIKKMMGYIANGTLNHTFNLRKQNIQKSVRFWLVTSLVLFFLAVVWIVIVFTKLSADTGVVWADILINALKSSLAVFAFGYALNEYSKERNLQEEYAFRESVAGTLSAYLEKLEVCEKEEMKKLLTDTVSKLYEKPVISSKEWKFGKLGSKEIADLVKPVAESINNLTSKK